MPWDPHFIHSSAPLQHRQPSTELPNALHRPFPKTSPVLEALLAENGLLHQAKIEDIVALGVAMEYVYIYIYVYTYVTIIYYYVI